MPTRPSWQMIERWIAEKQIETDLLEFKGKSDPSKTGLSDVDRKNLGKAASAFANTDGGAIVFGLAEKGGVADHVQELGSQLDDLAAIVAQSIRDGVKPTIAGVEATPVREEGGAGGVLVVTVPRSDAAPHSSEDRYHLRAGGTSIRMPHVLLAAYFGRKPQPSLELRLRLRQDLQVDLRLTNVGLGAAREVAVVLDGLLAAVGVSGSTWNGSTLLSDLGSTSLLLTPATVTYPVPMYSGMEWDVTVGSSLHQLSRDPRTMLSVGVKLYAVDAVVVQGRATLIRGGGWVTVRRSDLSSEP